MLKDTDFAKSQFDKNKSMINQAVTNLPSNRELLNKIKSHGFSTI